MRTEGKRKGKGITVGYHRRGGHLGKERKQKIRRHKGKRKRRDDGSDLGEERKRKIEREKERRGGYKRREGIKNRKGKMAEEDNRERERCKQNQSMLKERK